MEAPFLLLGVRLTRYSKVFTQCEWRPWLSARVCLQPGKLAGYNSSPGAAVQQSVHGGPAHRGAKGCRRVDTLHQPGQVTSWQMHSMFFIYFYFFSGFISSLSIQSRHLLSLFVIPVQWQWSRKICVYLRLGATLVSPARCFFVVFNDLTQCEKFARICWHETEYIIFDNWQWF